MILGFNKRFVEPIMAGTKIHTIREDAHDRWHAGRAIQMATGVRTKHYNCFKNTECISTQTIKIRWVKGLQVLRALTMCIDGKYASIDVMQKLAINDGFATWDDFCDWFKKDFDGKIIHWTDRKY